MSAIYAIVNCKKPNFQEMTACAGVLQTGLERYGEGGASEPSMGEKSLEIGNVKIILGSIQRNDHIGIPETPCVIETAHTIAVCDAMIYNRGSFPGQELLSDGELLVKIYEKEGFTGLRSLSADFTAVMIDKKSGQIFLLRDHMGVRPLYVLRTDSFMAVSTDYRPFFDLQGCRIEINEKNLYEHLVMGIISSRTETLFANILKSQAGSVTLLDPSSGNMASERYWFPGMRKVPICRSDGRYRKIYAKLIRDAVKNRAEAVGGEAIGAEFSGGLDSGIIVSILDEYSEENGKDMPVLATWSPSEEDYPIREKRDEVIRDEREVIRRFCEEKGNTCFYRPRRDSEDPEKYLKNIERKDICEYDADIITYTTDALKEKGIRTVFSGWGGDEAVTMRFGPSALLDAGEYRAFLNEAFYVSGGRPKKFLGFIRRALAAVWDNHRPWDGIVTNGWDFSLARPEYEERITRDREKKYNYFGWDPVKNLLTGGMESRTLVAASCAADAGMLYMFPMLDPLLIDYALNVPRRLFMKKGRRRLLPQTALADIVPGYLTSFSGESNVEKLDTGRMDFYYEVAEETQSRTDKVLMSRLDRKLFGEYTDLDEMERHLLNSENATERNVLRKIARTLYKMQILLEENDSAR